MRQPGFGLLALTLSLGPSPSTCTAVAAPTDRAPAPLTIDKGRLEQALEGMVSSGRAAGVSLLVWQDGRERFFGTAGFADREARRPMARDTLVQIWSMTKPVTGVALMQLWEAGRFRIDDPVARYLPEFARMRVLANPAASGDARYRPAARPITIRDLLRHTAGLAYGMRGGPVDAEYQRVEYGQGYLGPKGD